MYIPSVNVNVNVILVLNGIPGPIATDSGFDALSNVSKVAIAPGESDPLMIVIPGLLLVRLMVRLFNGAK